MFDEWHFLLMYLICLMSGFYVDVSKMFDKWHFKLKCHMFDNRQFMLMC